MAGKNPGPLVIFGNPGSESKAWQYVIELAEAAKNTRSQEHKEQYIRKLVAVAEQMLRQVERGVHANRKSHGGMIPRKTVKIADHVEAIVYINSKDKGQYVHGFGDADLNEADLQNGVLRLDQLNSNTDVEAYGHPDGSVTLVPIRGQPLVALFP